MSQLVHNVERATALEGQLADSGFKDKASVIAEEVIPAGRLVVTRTAGDPAGGDLPSATGEVTGPGVQGIAVLDTSREENVGYAIGDVLPALRKGRIYVFPEDAVAAAPQAAFVRFAAGGGGTGLGAFRTDADTASAVALPGARFMENCNAGAPCLLEYDLQD